MSSIPPAPIASVEGASGIGASGPGVVPRAPLRSAGGLASAALAQSVGQPMVNPSSAAPLAPAVAPAPRPSALRSVPTPAASAIATSAGGTHSTSSPALYNGFQQVAAQGLSERPPASASNAVLPTEDWYVGITGVPLGPVRLAVLREKATQGQVNEDSLVWREGYEEWLPIKKVPALLEIVEEAKGQRNSRSSGLPVPAPSNLGGSPFRNSALTAPLSSGLPSSDLGMSGLGLGVAAAGTRPIEPLVTEPLSAEPSSPDLGEATVAQNVSPAAGLTLGTEPAPPADTAGPTILKDPFAAPPSNGGAAVPAKTDVGPGSFGMNTSAAFGADKAASYQATESYIPGVPSRRKGMHPMVWAFIAMAAAFGGVAAWAVFLRQKDVVYVSQSAQPAAATTSGTAKTSGSTSSATTEATIADSSEPPVASGSSAGSAVATWSGVGPRPSLASGSAKKSSDAAPFDSSGFGGTTPAGPSATATGGSNSTGQTLSEGQASGVVSRNTPRVRRACWDPQLQTRSSSAPNSVKVTASLQIAPNGSVKSASVSGGNEKHYPGLVSCIKAAVSTWSFPVTDEGGTVNVPFNFAAQ